MAPRTPLVYEDLESFPEDNLRREILGGELYVTPSPTRRHQEIVLSVAVALRSHGKRAGGHVYIAPLDTVLSAQNVVEPDVVFIAPDRQDTLGDKAIIGVPSLLVEVLSPGTAATDRGRKRDLYARFNVAEYWIVDPDANAIERCSHPVEGVYRDIVTFENDMPAATLDLVLSFEKIFR